MLVWPIHSGTWLHFCSLRHPLRLLCHYLSRGYVGHDSHLLHTDFIAANPYLSVGRYLDSSLFRWIGKKSYALFLWQYPVIFLFQYMHWTDGTYLNGVHTVSLLSGLSLTIDVSAAAVWIAPLAELSLIILLSIWSDCITSSLTTFHLPRANQSFVTLQLVLFLLIALPPFVMAGYGCKGIFYATSHATTRTNHVQKLQEQMKDNEQFCNRSKRSQSNKKSLLIMWSKLAPLPALATLSCSGLQRP